MGIWEYIYPQAELCHTLQAEARLVAVRQGSAEPMLGPQGARVCVPAPGETHHIRGRESPGTGRDTPVTLSGGKGFLRELVATDTAKRGKE